MFSRIDQQETTMEMTIQEYRTAREEILNKYRSGEWDTTKAVNTLAKLKIDFLRGRGSFLVPA